MRAPRLLHALLGAALAVLAAVPSAAGPWVGGSVLTAAGESPEAALVELLPILSDYELGRLRLQGVELLTPAVAGRTAQGGRFRLEAPRRGLYRLVVRMPGHVPAQIGPIALVEDLEVAPVTLQRDARTHIQVVDSRGPVGGAWVFASGEENLGNGWRLDFRLGKAGADGSLTLPRRPGEKLDLFVFSPSLGEMRSDGFEGGQVRFPPAGNSHRLRVLSEEGAPLPGILLRYGARAWPVGPSDADGMLHLPPAAGDTEARLVGADGGQQPLPSLAGLTVRLSAARPLLGRVVDARTGRPIAGALAWSDRDPGSFAATDENGRYRLAVSAKEGSAIEVAAAGYLKGRIDASPGQVRLGRAPTLGLEPAASLAGIAIGNGRPVEGAVVEAIPYGARGERELDPRARVVERAATDAQGGFRLRRLQAGERYELRARREGWFPAAVEAAALEPAERVRLELAPVRALAGQVKDSAGQALQGVEIDIRPAVRAGRVPPVLLPPEDAGALPRTDEQGRFLLAMPPAAAVDIVFRKSGFAPFSLRRVRISPGEGPFRLRPVVLQPGAALRGRVVDGTGQPVPGAEVFLLEEEPRFAQTPPLADRPMSTTSPAGVFRFPDLPAAAPLHLFVRARGFQPAVLRSVLPREEPIVVTLEPGLALRGRVVDEAGSPIAGAGVEASWQPTLPGDPERRPAGMPVSFQATTQRSGRFEITGIPRGLVTLTVEARGFLGREAGEIDVPLPPDSPEIEVVLETGTTLAGRVTTTAGEPVSGARIGVGNAGGVSDQDGQYLVEGAPPGLQRVSVFHLDYPRLEITHRLEAESNTLDLQLEAGTEVSGRVVNGQGRPVSGATVSLSGPGRREYTATSGTDGGFIFPTVARARYRLRAGREGFADADAQEEILVERDPVAGLEITLREGATLTGSILGLPPDELARVAVEAILPGARARRAEIDAEGRYRLANLQPGDWTIRASLRSGERQATAYQPILAGDRAVEKDLEFSRRLRLAGRVLYEGEPLPDAAVSVRGRRFSTQRSRVSGFDGQFVLDDLEPDTYELGVSHPAQLLKHNGILELSEDREIEVRLEAATVRGRVTAAGRGTPLPGARISLRHRPTPAAPEFLVAGIADADGRFTLPQVPAETYELEVAADGYIPLTQSLALAAGTEPPELEIGLEPAPGLRLQVRLADGSAPRIVHLLAKDAAGRVGAAATVPVDRTGHAELSTLAEGRWTLLVGAETSAASVTEVQIPGPPVTLTLPPSGRLGLRVPALLMSQRTATVRLVSAAGQPVWTLNPGGSLLSEWTVEGNATISGLPEGPCTVYVEASDGRRWSAAAMIVAGRETAITLE